VRTLGACLGLGACLLAAGSLAPPAARAEDPAGVDAAAVARAHHQAGLARYAARDFAAAAREFAAAYALDPRRESLFAEAQATRLGGDCTTATRLYRDFLATAPPQQQVEATTLALARCEAPAAVVPLVPPVTRAPAASLLAPAARAPWWRDQPGLLLSGGAALGFAVAGGFLAAALHADGQAGEAGGYRTYDERRQVAEDRARWAGRAALAGLALAAGAGGRFLWVRFGSGSASGGMEGRF
jgi:hypothetical protein